MRLTTRGFADLVGSCDVTNIYKELQELKQEYEIADMDKVEGEIQFNLPVEGKCEVPPYPIYLAPLGQPSGDSGFNMSPFARMSQVVSDILPGLGPDSLSEVFLTPSPRLDCWQVIERDNCPKKVHKQGILGVYEVWIDTSYPNANGEISWPRNMFCLLSDLLLRADTRCKVRDEAIAKGFGLISSNTKPIEGEATPFALFTRGDAFLEYNINTNKWQRPEECSEPSAAYNFTQLNEFAVQALPGQYVLTGKKIAEIVLSVEDAVNQLASIYEEHLATFLSTSRFRITHPIDTVGFFMRYSANGATRYFRWVSDARVCRFPIFLKDTISSVWYTISTELCPTMASEVPTNITKAGELGGIYEVYYEEAEDLYTSEQLAWLVKVIADSPTIVNTKGVIAMRGCMNHLNTAFSRFTQFDVVKGIPAVNGTRFTDLSPLPGGQKEFRATFSFKNPYMRDYGYSSMTASCIPITGNSATEPVSAACCSWETGVHIIAQAISSVIGSGFLEDAERIVAGDSELQLLEPLQSIKDWYFKDVHAYEPAICADGYDLYLVTTEGEVFHATKEYGWATDIDLQLPDKATEAGTIFENKLYVLPNARVALEDIDFQHLFVSTLSYFVPFSKYPTLFNWLYTYDTDGPWYEGAEQAGYAYLSSASKPYVWCYEVIRNCWTTVDKSRAPRAYSGYFHQLGFAVSESFTPSAEILVAALQSLQRFLPTIPPCEVQDVFKRFDDVRPISDKVSTRGPISFRSYTYCTDPEVQDWVVYEGTDAAKSGFSIDGEITSADDFISAIIGWLTYLASYKNAEGAWDYMNSAIGPTFTQVPTLEEPTAHVWVNHNRYFQFTNGEWDVHEEPLSDNLFHYYTYHGFNVSITSSSLTLYAEQLAAILSMEWMPGAVVQTTCDSVTYSDVEARDAMKVYERTVPGLYKSIVNRVSNNVSTSTPFLYVGPYGYDGNKWSKCTTEDKLEVGELCGCKVYLVPGLEKRCVSTKEACDCLAVILELIFEPKLCTETAICKSLWRK